MTRTSPEPSIEASPPSPLRAVRPRRWQWSLLTLLLIMAIVATWSAYYRAQRDMDRVRRELPSLRKLARQLVISDPSLYAVVEREPNWKDETEWEVFLPPGAEYQLRLATREIDEQNVPSPQHEFELSSGRHVIAVQKMLSDHPPAVYLVLDGQTLPVATETENWFPGAGIRWSHEFLDSQQRTTAEPLILQRIKFQPRSSTSLPSKPPQDATTGMLLWIEKKS